jgi:hypothetical protein
VSVDDEGDRCILSANGAAYIYVERASADRDTETGEFLYRLKIVVRNGDQITKLWLSPEGARELAAWLCEHCDELDAAKAETARTRAQYLAEKAAKAAGRKRK